MLDEYKDKVLIHRFDNEPELITALVDQMAAAVEAALSRKPEFILAVSGGRSPVPLFRSLAKSTAIPWTQGRITLVDERYVPPDDSESNERLVRELLLQDQAAGARFEGLYQPDKSCASRVEQLNRRPQFSLPDIAILGLGMDGHTASLFPCSPEFDHNLTTADIYVTASPQTAPHERISLSAIALIAVPQLWLYLPGAAKLERFAQILNGDDPQSPMATIMSKRRDPLEVFTCP